MFSIKPLHEFTVWLDGLTDVTVRGVVVARIKRLELGLMGDVAPVLGKGYRSCAFIWARAGASISRNAMRN